MDLTNEANIQLFQVWKALGFLKDFNLNFLDDQGKYLFILSFQEQWIRRQPVIMPNVLKKLDIANLWSPDTFLNEFGHIRHNTYTGRVIPNVKLKMFWDGFENLQERIKDELGRAMSLKVHH